MTCWFGHGDGTTAFSYKEDMKDQGSTVTSQAS